MQKTLVSSRKKIKFSTWTCAFFEYWTAL